MIILLLLLLTTIIYLSLFSFPTHSRVVLPITVEEVSKLFALIRWQHNKLWAGRENWNESY